MNSIQTAQKIIEYVGGENNIVRVWNCMTRIRFNLIDDSLVLEDKLKSLDMVINIQKTPSQFQIIIGKNVDVLTKDINKMLVKTINIEKKVNNVNQSKPSFKMILNNIIETITSIFSPILPAIIGAGMMKVIISLITILDLFPNN